MTYSSNYTITCVTFCDSYCPFVSFYDRFVFVIVGVALFKVAIGNTYIEQNSDYLLLMRQC